MLNNVVLSHISVRHSNYRPKAIFLALMARRVIQANLDNSTVDDKDYYGNKRLELAGPLLAILFEDLLKKFNGDLKQEVDRFLSKTNRAAQFDVTKCFRAKTIADGLLLCSFCPPYMMFLILYRSCSCHRYG